MYTIANQRPTVVFIRTLFFLSFCYASKRRSSFLLYIPRKNPLLSTKYELSTSFSAEYSYNSKWVVQLMSHAKNWPAHELCYAPLEKYLS